MRLNPQPWNENAGNVALPEAGISADAADRRFLAKCLRRSLDPARAAVAADRLLDRFGSLSGVLGASDEALVSVDGVDAEAAADFHLLRDLTVRLARVQVGPRSVISSWTALLSYVAVSLRHERREQFRVLFLDARNCLIRDELMGAGTTDHAPVYPREVIRRALELCAAAVILLHNHPTGDPTPSRADIDMTKQITEAGRLLKIAVHDHLIVGATGVASFKSLGLI